MLPASRTVGVTHWLMAAVTAIAMLLPTGVSASELSKYSVADLLEPCIEGDNDSRWGEAAEADCEQYINGFTDAILLTNVARDNNICLPKLNRPDEVRWAFVKWAHQNFDDRRMPAADGLLQAIQSAFKCP